MFSVSHNSTIFENRNRDVSDMVKNIIEDLINTYDCKAKKLHVKIMRKNIEMKLIVCRS